MARRKKQTKNKTTSPLTWIEATKTIDYLRKKQAYPELLIISVGCYTGYRLVDLLKLKYKDFDGDRITIIANKTGKPRTVPIFSRIKEIVEECRKGLKKKKENFLFTRTRFISNVPISRMSALTWIKKGFKIAGVEREMLSGHTLRKTYALRKFEGLKDKIGEYRALNEIAKDLRHDSVKATRTYLSIPQSELEEINASMFDD